MGNLKIKAYVMNLPFAEDRRANAERWLQMAGIDYEIICGCNPKEEEAPYDNSQWGAALYPKDVGIVTSHLRCLRRMLEEGLDWAYIFEDDFILENDVHVGLCELPHHFPHPWHHIQLHGFKLWNDGYKRLYQHGMFHRVKETTLLAHGYAIHHTLARFILQYYPIPIMPMDWLYITISKRSEFFFYDLETPIIGSGDFGTTWENDE